MGDGVDTKLHLLKTGELRLDPHSLAGTNISPVGFTRRCVASVEIQGLSFSQHGYGHRLLEVSGDFTDIHYRQRFAAPGMFGSHRSNCKHIILSQSILIASLRVTVAVIAGDTNEAVRNLRWTDERDAIQKKTFTKWVNKHLKKALDRSPIVAGRGGAVTGCAAAARPVHVDRLRGSISDFVRAPNDACWMRWMGVLIVLFVTFVENVPWLSAK
ncbi:hypothetical protein EVAR_80681_1 [Eumeta japonica]|uniref:Uncharacterized protein n=1 Tax=Eumeta variegata TaxID=151549 RepID=A0A4C1U396_EUMVA|nr:hypothetical protein EVAR_80681_1 [Eumeta japonica]